jgi:hypothetical protein
VAACSNPLGDYYVAASLGCGDRFLARADLPEGQRPSGVNHVHQPGVRLAIEELHHPGGSGGNLDAAQVERGPARATLEVQWGNDEVDPEWLGGQPMQPIEHSREGCRAQPTPGGTQHAQATSFRDGCGKFGRRQRAHPGLLDRHGTADQIGEPRGNHGAGSFVGLHH